MNVFISPNLKKEAVFINPNGDFIDKKTKQILVPNVVEAVAIEDIQVVEAKANQVQVNTEPVSLNSPLDIQKQIEQKEKELESLKELKRQKIAEMKKQLEILEA